MVGVDSSLLGDIIPEIVCLGVDVLICGVLYSAYKITKQASREIQGAPIINIDDKLVNQISNHQNALRTTENGQELIIIPYGIVQGQVKAIDSKTLLPSLFDKNVQGVIQKFSITEHKRNLSRTGFWYDSKKTIKDFLHSVPFGLVNHKTKHMVQIVDPKDATRLDVNITHDDFVSSPSTLGSHLLGWISGDIQKGVQTTEEMLQEGTILSGIGEVVYDKLNNTVQLQSPNVRPELNYYLVKDTPKMVVKDLESSAKVLKWILIIFGGVGVAIGAFGGYRYYKNWLVQKQNRENQERLRQIRSDRSRKSESPLDPQNACVVCLSREREVILLDCGHLCVCADCGDELLNRSSNCPICRSNIQRVSPVYVS